MIVIDSPGRRRNDPPGSQDSRWRRAASSLTVVELSWEDSRGAFTDAAEWFVDTTARVDGRWDETGLGEWDIRALVGHTTRSFLTVESYLEDPPDSVEIASAADYYLAVRSIAAAPGVAARGREAGEALGPDPAARVAEIAERVVRLVETRDGTELLTTLVGGMRLRDYLPTRVFELAVHTTDLASALDLPLDVPPSAAAQALQIVNDIAVADGLAGRLLLAATGREGAGTRFTVL